MLINSTQTFHEKFQIKKIEKKNYSHYRAVSNVPTLVRVRLKLVNKIQFKLLYLGESNL